MCMGFARAGRCAPCSGASFVDLHPHDLDVRELLENGTLESQVELIAVVQRDHGVADRAADPRDRRDLADQRASRIRSIRSGIAIGPSTAVIPQRAPHQASTATAVSKAGAGWRNTARGA